MISVLEFAYNDKVIDLWEYNMLLELIKEAEEHVFCNYPEIKKEVDPMVANLLNLQSVQMKRELEQQKKATKQASLSAIETIKKFGVILTDEQVQEILDNAMEPKKLEE